TIPLSRLRDVQLQVTVELGRTSMIVSDVLALEIGSVIELDRSAGAPIDVRVNGTLLARGEVVVVDDEYAIRLTEMIDPDRG
ncbi:MAG: flagellar motor switch protein FliN, partial [Acidimicrobiia bacterium]|nr:flagellar motor switch protein FliN [Acidimicrobiia bacterium]